MAPFKTCLPAWLSTSNGEWRRWVELQLTGGLPGLGWAAPGHLARTPSPLCTCRPKPKSHSFDVGLLDGDAQLKVAAATASCKTCLFLAQALLEGLYTWVDRTLALPSAGQVSAYADQLCMVQVCALPAMQGLRVARPVQ